jgi:phosphoribulokinase
LTPTIRSASGDTEILLGTASDPAAATAKLTRGPVRILGKAQVTHISTDRCHRYDPKQRAARGLTPLHPDCHADIVQQPRPRHLRPGESILKPRYRHQDRTFAAAEYVQAVQFAIVRGRLAFHAAPMRVTYDVRVPLQPPNDLHRQWKRQDDCAR